MVDFMGYCEACQKPLFGGEKVVNLTTSRRFKEYICLDCMNRATKEDLIEWLGLEVEEL